MPRNWNFYLCLILMLLGPRAFCGEVLVLGDGVERYALGRHLDYFDDKSASLPFSEIMSEAFAGRFQSNRSETPNFGHTVSNLWFRVALQNDSLTRSEWLLEVQAPRLHQAEVYLAGEDGRIDYQVSGMSLPFSYRAVVSRHINFKLTLLPGQKKNLFVRATGAGSMQLPMVLWQPEAFTKADHDEQMLMGLYYGAIIAILLVNLMAFATTRDITFIYYVAYLASFGLFQFALNGHWFEYVFSNRPEMMQWILLLLIALASSSGLQFTRAFFDLRQHMPRANRLLHVLSLVPFLSIGIACLAGIAPAIKMTTAFGFVNAITGFAVTFLCLRRRVVQVRYFLIAWTGLLIGVIAIALRNFEILPSVFITDYGLQIGSFLELVLLSY
jgi:two-component system, sensor histidine kinase LadS